MKQGMGVCIVLLGICALASTGYSGLVHRYTFDGNANDSVGTANGTLINNTGAAVYADGKLDLKNTGTPTSNASNINYVNLPNGIISSLGENATFEAWVTWNGPVNTWQRVFDFGTSDQGEGFSSGGSNSTYLFMTTRGGNAVYRVGYRRGDELGAVEERIIDGTAALPVGQQVHVAMVWDGSNQQVRLYLNGQFLNSAQPNFTLTDLPDVNNWLGRSQWADPVFNGIYNEFRIYDLALDDTQIQLSYQSGPDSPLTVFIELPANPSPTNGRTGLLSNVTLSWNSSDSPLITGHQVYLGTDKTAVQNATIDTPGIYLGTLAPSIQTFNPGPLNLRTTYYWKIGETTTEGKTLSGAVWNFSTIDILPGVIAPPDGAGNISSQFPVTLKWSTPDTAGGYHVYFGLNPLQLASKAQYLQTPEFIVSSLLPQTTYYWRIDSVIPQSTQVVTGPVWSFMTLEKTIACIPGDLDGNCAVELQDLFLFSQQWLSTQYCAGFDCADIDRDGHINLTDFAAAAANWNTTRDPLIVINEIHYHPDKNTEPVEFIEIYNAGGGIVDLSGWKIEDGVDFAFPNGTSLTGGGFFVIAQNAAAFGAKFGFFPAGVFTGTLRNEGETITLRNSQGKKIDEVSYDHEFPWSIAADGEGASLELIHPLLDNDLAGSWRPSGYLATADPEAAFGTPTPGRENTCRNVQAPPQIRQVEHQAVGAPAIQDKHQPNSNQDIQITVKVTDPDGVKCVILLYQIVAPGNFIPSRLPLTPSELMANPFQPRPKNPAFENPVNWSSLAMKDDGIAPDVVANDGVYTAVVPKQINRTLLRYRITAEDSLANSIRVPYADDPSLNFACSIYNGVPDYIASKDSVHPDGPGHVYPASVLMGLPVYTMIARADDIAECMSYDGFQIPHDGSLYNESARRAENWEGAFVYEGKVYDHMRFRLRGGNGRYYAGKRAMTFQFNRGNYLQARDLFGDPFPRKWNTLVIGKMRGNHQIGRYGLNEVLNMRLWNLNGVPAPEFHWFHFRVVDGANEAPATTNGQYEGDFWGMFIALEDYDGGFIEHHELAKGNLYKLSSRTWDGWRMLRYQGPDALEVIDNVPPADYENIRWDLNPGATADFIVKYLDYQEWSRYHAVAEAIRHYDVFSGGDNGSENLKNMSWYFAPEYTAANPYGKLWFMPFDTDDTWGPYWNFGVDHAKAAVFEVNHYNQEVVFPLSPAKLPLRIEYRNALRQFRDLHWQPEVIDGMIDELAKSIEAFLPAERDRWRLDSITAARHDDGTLEECVADMKRFAWEGGSYWPGNGVNYWPGSGANLDNLSNAEEDWASIPNTPTIQYAGSTNFPSNQLRFTTSAFSDPQDNGTFAAMEWRIGEYQPYVPPDDLPQPTEIVWIDKGSNWRYFLGTQEPSSVTGAWRTFNFNDTPSETEWLENSAPIGYDPTVTFGTRLNGKYCTLYFRKKFEVSAAELSAISQLRLEVLFDDGFKVWINEQPVQQGNAPATEIPYNGDLKNYSGYTYRENNAYASYTIDNAQNYLTVGTNIISVQLVNYDYPSSSDCFLDLKLVGIPDSSLPITTYKIKKRKFEIEPVWESGELTTFSDTVRIPPYALRSGRTYRARCRMKDTTGRWSHWSDPVEFTTTDPVATGVTENLRLTELMYNPTKPAGSSYKADDFEFIEFKNIGEETLDLSTVQITDGITFDFGSAASKVKTLAPGAFVLVVRNQKAFESRYGTAWSNRIAGAFNGGLNNDSELIRVVDAWYGTVVTCTYSDGWGWPKPADGSGHSLVPLQASYARQYLGSLNYGAMWRSSAFLNGSPGRDDPEPTASVIINEVRAHTDFSDPQQYPGYDSNDWIELVNPTDVAVTFTNWYLSDDVSNLKKWHIGIRTLNPDERICFDEIHDFHSPLTSGFGLDKAGEMVVLSYLPGTAEDRVVDCIRFKGQENETVKNSGQFVSFGRYPDGGSRWFTMLASRDSTNSAPLNHVMIREFMYHPMDVNDKEYIELYNPLDHSVPLTAEGGPWRLDGQVDFTFPQNVSIPPHQRILVVGFDPSVSGDLEIFQSRYGIGPLTAGVDIFGPWIGDLANDTGRIAIEKPLMPDLPDTDIPWVVVDEVLYYDDDPWPAEADGQGGALRRMNLDPTVSSNDSSIWQAVIPLH